MLWGIGMVEILIQILIIIFIYILPLVIFVIYSKNLKLKNYIKVILAVIYILGVIITSDFMDNLLPFLAVVFCIFSMKKKSVRSHETISTGLIEDDYIELGFSVIKTDWVKAITYSVSMYVINILIAVVFAMMFLKLGVGQKQQEIVSDMEGTNLINFLKYIPVSIIFAPMLEEFLFRFVLFQKVFKNRVGIVLAAIVSSILFSMLHYNLKSFPILLALGIENCYLIQKKGYWYAVANHSFFNLMTVVGILVDKIK